MTGVHVPDETQVRVLTMMGFDVSQQLFDPLWGLHHPRMDAPVYSSSLHQLCMVATALVVLWSKDR